MSETYQNRRGHKVSIAEAVDEIVMHEAAPEETTKATKAGSKTQKKTRQPKKTQPTKAKKPKSPKKPKLSRLKISKKVLIAIGLVLVLMLSLGLVMTDGMKRDFERQASTMRRQVTHLSKSTAASETIGSEVAKHLNDSLDEATDCGSGVQVVVDWYSPAKTAKQHCQEVADTYNQLKTELSAIEHESHYVETVANQLRDALKSPTGGEFASIPEYQKRWDETREAVSKIDAPDSLDSAHQKLVKTVGQIAKSWQQLLEANADQDVSSFQQSEKDISKSYEQLRTFDNDVASPLDDRQQTIDGLVEKLAITE